MHIKLASSDYDRLMRDAKRAESLDHSLSELRSERDAYQSALDLVIAAIMQCSDFKAWLIEQDLSSTLADGASSASRKRRARVEGADDLELACAWANHATRKEA